MGTGPACTPEIWDRMQEVQPPSHTIQTHGASLAQKHTHDWVVLILLAATVVVLHYVPAFNRFVGRDMMTDIRYPVKPSTVPAWAFPVISIVCPLVIFISVYFTRRNVYDLHHAALGVLFAVLITAFFTDTIKIAVGRPRPDFFWRCFPDGKQLYDQVNGEVICHGEKSFLRDGRKSFPSGHTSCWGPYAYFHMLEEFQAANSSIASQSTCEHHIGISEQQHNSRLRNDLESRNI